MGHSAQLGLNPSLSSCSLRNEIEVFIERRFFGADSTDADASIDRVARCLAPLHLHASRQTLFDIVGALESRALSVNLCFGKLLHVLLLLPPDPQPCQRRPIPTLVSLPAPAFLLFLPLLFLPLFFYLHLFPSPPVFLHRDKFKAR